MVVDSIKELPAETQRIFFLYHGSRMTYPDIARELGITTRTVERHMAQAIAHCKLRIKAYL
jgi:RNA polymerase sigma-70 factor (ECF subfamily)